MQGTRLAARPVAVEVPPDLRARLASSRFTIEALAPLVTEAVATYREAVGVADVLLSAEPDPDEVDEVWAAVVGESGAADLLVALRTIGDLVADVSG